MDKIDVLYVSDDNCITSLGVSLTSLFINNECNDIHVYIVDDHISDENKKKIEDCAKSFNRTINFLEMPDMIDLIGFKVPSGGWPENIFCRLFVPTLFLKNPDVTRVLYIDTDTLICAELSKLMREDISGYVCGAVLECMSNLHKKAIGLTVSDPYLNSGVLRIDVKRWKQEGIEEKCKDYAKQFLLGLEYPDEGIINGVLRGQFKK